MKNNETDIEKITKKLEEEGCRVLTEEELRLKVNGGWGKSSSGGSSSSTRSSSSGSHGGSGGSRNSSKGSSGSSGTAKNNSGSSKKSGSGGTTKTSFGQKVSNVVNSIKSWAQAHAPTNKIDNGYGSSGKNNNDSIGSSQQYSSGVGSSKSREIENTNHAVANARPGDTITRSNGTKVTLTQADINYAKAHDTTSVSSSAPSAGTSVNTTPAKNYSKTGSKNSSKTAKKDNAVSTIKNAVKNTVSTYTHSGTSSGQSQVNHLVDKAVNFVKQKIRINNATSQRQLENIDGIQETELAKIIQNKFEAVKGKPYGTDEIWGDDGVVSKDSNQMNCIGFVTYVYGKKCMYGVENFDKYSGFDELTNITDVSQLQVGDVICWEGIEVDGDVNNHAQIWAGDGMVWESAESTTYPETSCVRYERFSRLERDWYYNPSCMKQDTVSVRYFRPTAGLVGEVNG